MKDTTATTVNQFFEIIEKYQRNSWLKFRGQSNADWKIIPKAGRDVFCKYDDKAMFESWKRRGKTMIEKEQLNDWDYLAIAQHTGLPTRLLDWSHNPLIACFFACNENFENDGVVYIYDSEHWKAKTETTSPFDFKGTGLIVPTVFNQRIGNQFGYFTIHGNPKQEFNKKNCEGKLSKIVIKRNIKKDIIFRLNHYGINYLTIYPDLEGLSKHLCWFSENFDYWTEESRIELGLTK
jgi:hypothetical protein